MAASQEGDFNDEGSSAFDSSHALPLHLSRKQILCILSSPVSHVSLRLARWLLVTDATPLASSCPMMRKHLAVIALPYNHRRLNWTLPCIPQRLSDYCTL